MSHSHLTREELEARLDRLEDAVDDLEATDAAQAKDAAADRRRISELEATADALADRVDTLEAELDRVNRERAALARRLTAVEDATDVTADASSDGGTPSPLQLLARIGPEAVAIDDGPTLRRAYHLARNRERWGETLQNTKYGQHHVLATKHHDLRTRLEDARDEDLSWNQVYRALQLCADLGGPHARLDEGYATEDTDWGKALVLQEAP